MGGDGVAAPFRSVSIARVDYANRRYLGNEFCVVRICWLGLDLEFKTAATDNALYMVRPVQPIDGSGRTGKAFEKFSPARNTKTYARTGCANGAKKMPQTLIWLNSSLSTKIKISGNGKRQKYPLHPSIISEEL